MTGTKISQYPTTSSPPTSMLILGTDVTDTSQSATGTTKTTTIANLVAAAGGGGGGGGLTGWHDLVGTYGADPTGATSCSTQLANACTAAVAAQPAPFGLTVPPGIFQITASQDLPYNMIMRGAGESGGDVTGQYIGSVFRLGASFTGTYGFGFRDTGHVSGATGVNGAIVTGIFMDGGLYTGGSAIDGFYIYGPTMCTFEDVKIARMTGWAINASGQDSSQGQQFPFGQVWTGVSADSCGTVSGGGFNLVGCEDSVFTGCYSIGNGNGPGFLVNACDNSKFTACNSEWNSNYGYYITGDWEFFTGACQFSNCSTDANGTYGVYIDATWSTGGGAGTGPALIQFSNIFCRRDGQGNPSASAGIALGATTLPVLINGFGTMTDIGDSGTGSMAPAWGLYFTQSSYAQPVGIFNGLAWGLAAAYRTGSTNNSLPTLTTGSTAGIMKAHGNNYAPTYGS